MSLAGESEDAVVLLAMAGDDDAFEERVLRRQRWLRNLLRRLSGDATLADDLCQEAFFKAWKALPKLKDHRAFPTWLRQIAVRRWIDASRSMRSELEIADPDLWPMEGTISGAGAADQRLDLYAALATLRPGPRLCVVLHYGEGMSHSEIASTIGISIGVVKSHLSRSTQRLRARLQDWRIDER